MLPVLFNSDLDGLFGRDVIDSLFKPLRVNIDKNDIRVNISESTSRFLIVASLPGIEKEEVDLSVDKERIHIQVTRKASSGSVDETYSWREILQEFGDRFVTLPKTANLEKMEAKLDKGLLYITVPKKEEEVKKKITIV